MFFRGIDFGGGRSTLTISAEQANPLAAILYQQVLGDSIRQALRGGVPRSRTALCKTEAQFTLEFAATNATALNLFATFL